MSTERLLTMFGAALVIVGGCGSGDEVVGDGGADASMQRDGAASDGAAAVDGAAGADGAPSTTAEHVLTTDCAPGGGPALRLVLTDQVNAECEPNAETGYVAITVYVDSVDAPQTLAFSSENPEGRGEDCDGLNAPCLLYEEGEVHFETFTEEVEATGTWSLGGGSQGGTFDAAWCEPNTPILC